MGWATIVAAPLENEHVLLRPVQPEDRKGLHEQAMDPSIWRFFVFRIETDDDFDAFFDLALADQEAGRRCTFVITDKVSGRIAGSMSMLNMSELDLRLEIGWSWLGKEFQGHGINRWAKYLMMEHAFERMLAERVEFKTDALNTQARHGLCNIGATEEGILRSFNPMPDGRRRDAVYFSVLKHEWPRVKEILGSQPKVTVAEATVTAAPVIPFLHLKGSPHEIGRADGAERAAELRAFLDDDLCRLNRVLASPLTLEELRPTIDAYDAEIAAAAPALAEEIGGLAEGAGITRHEAVLLQIRREVMGYQKIPTRGDCTTYARSGGDGVLAQTIDLNSDVEDQIALLEVAGPRSSRRALVLSFHGLLGYLGVNSDGLAVGLNLVLGGDWRPGLPPYLAIRHLLDSAGSVGEALEILAGLRLASSRSLTLCDGERSVWVEILGDEQRVEESYETTHTNHFLHPDFEPLDELNVFARNSSKLRLKACRAGLEELPEWNSVEDYFTVLSAAPIQVTDTGDIRREKTVATVVMIPGQGEIHIHTEAATLGWALRTAADA